MFGNILGKKKSEVSSEDREHAELVEKISKMKLTDMRAYINNRILNFEVNEDVRKELDLLLEEETTLKG